MLQFRTDNLVVADEEISLSRTDKISVVADGKLFVVVQDEEFCVV